MGFITADAFEKGVIIDKEWEAWSDPDSNYDFAFKWIVLSGGYFWVVGEAGCSCYSPGDAPEIEAGPLKTLAEVREYVEKEYASNEETNRYYRNMREDMLSCIDAIAQEMP